MSPVKMISLKTQAGVSLIEVLVALLLMSIAGFSVLAMSSFATQESNSLRFEITADYLGRSLLSRAQTNAAVSNKNIYDIDSTSFTSTTGSCASGCSLQDIAQQDIAEWSAEATSMLPNVRYKTWWVNNQLRLAIAWTGPVNHLSATDCPITTSANDACRVYTANIAI